MARPFLTSADNLMEQGAANDSLKASARLLYFFRRRLCWSTAALVCLHTAYGCRCPVSAEVRTRKRPRATIHLTLIRKSLPTSAIKESGNLLRLFFC